MNVVNDLALKVILLSVVLALLPQSPFNMFNSLMADIPYLGFLNWFIPINEILVITESVLAVITIYYTFLYLANFVGIFKQ